MLVNNGFAYIHDDSTVRLKWNDSYPRSWMDDVVGEVKITDDGAVRIKVFNRSNQYLLVTNDVPYTQGVGIFYRKEFDVFDDLRKERKKKQ